MVRTTDTVTAKAMISFLDTLVLPKDMESPRYRCAAIQRLVWFTRGKLRIENQYTLVF